MFAEAGDLTGRAPAARQARGARFRLPEEMLETELLNTATKEKYWRLFNFVKSMRVRQKRQLFHVLRHVPDIRADTFLPEYGLHCGEFACFQILSEHCRKDVKREDRERSSATS